jgi:hypothetical protein
MAKITRSLTVDEKVWNQAKKKAGSRKLSPKIEEMLKDWINYEDEDEHQDTDLLEKSSLTEKQKKAVRLLLQEDRTEIGIQSFMQFVKREGIYDRRDFIKKAVKRISKDEFTPYKKEGSQIVVQEIQCFCGSAMSATALDEGKCVKCGTRLLELEEEESGLKVV